MARGRAASKRAGSAAAKRRNAAASVSQRALKVAKSRDGGKVVKAGKVKGHEACGSDGFTASHQEALVELTEICLAEPMKTFVLVRMAKNPAYFMQKKKRPDSWLHRTLI